MRRKRRTRAASSFGSSPSFVSSRRTLSAARLKSVIEVSRLCEKGVKSRSVSSLFGRKAVAEAEVRVDEPTLRQRLFELLAELPDVHVHRAVGDRKSVV